MQQSITQRIEALRTYMKENGLDAFIFPSTDPHCGEYIPAHWATREWISGFNGSAGTAVVTLNEAALWTDSRYFLAAAEQLAGTPFVLMKDKLATTPSISEWLCSVLSKGSIVGVDETVNPFSFVEFIKKELSVYGINVNTSHDPADSLWTDRPQLPNNEIKIHSLQFAGIKAAEKIEMIRRKMKDMHADTLIVSALDEIAWTLNLRGNDIHCNPVFVSYMTITDTDCTLFVDSKKCTTEVLSYLEGEGVKTEDYNAIHNNLSKMSERNVLLDLSASNYSLYKAIPANCNIINMESPIAVMKAIKNPTEIAGYRNAMKRDGVAMVKFLKWLKPAVKKGGETEISISDKLYYLRSEQDLFKDISFDTIAGYGPHGAIVHYEATPETDAVLQPHGLLLLDSGAQYLDGTTDITRTIALGETTQEEKHDYTLVLKGHIRLAMVKFPENSSGTQLDICARYAMWQEGTNYLHGTGHGVGSFLNVHEGPHQLRMNYMPTPLKANMTLTNEPGIYRTGKHGVRIENTQIIIPFCESEFGPFLQFDPLTLCPIDMEPIEWGMLDNTEIEWLNNYHKRVYEELSPLLDEEHRIWLAEATKAKEII